MATTLPPGSPAASRAPSASVSASLLLMNSAMNAPDSPAEQARRTMIF